MRKAALRLPVFTTAVVSAIALAGSSAAGATDPIPLQLQGQWAIPTPSQGGTEYLKLEDSHFEFSHHNPSTGTAKGQLSVSGNTITFYSSNQCTGTGTYDWSLSDGGLTFVQAPGSSDPCQREAVLTSGTWTLR
jgi:hypothetical protein